jgi:2-polyprenyl-6-methoxyphenol hydroxylase-like FAD-dependent oxidoreductase
MTRPRKTDVLVVGAGPVGLYTALRLADAGIDVEIVDQEWQTASQSYALALHPSSLTLLDEVGLADEVIDQGRRVDTIALYDRERRRAELQLGELGTRFPFILVHPQSVLERSVEDRLRRTGTKVKWSHRLSGLDTEQGSIVARIDRMDKVSSGYAVATTEWVIQKTMSVEAGFVIGADGHRSAVREALGIGFEARRTPELFAVFEFYSDGESGNEARIVVDEDTVSVLWPLPGERWRWSFQLPEDDHLVRARRRQKSRLALQIGGEAFPHLEQEQLQELVAERAPWFDLAITDIRWSIVVRFENRMAEPCGRGNVVLAGDAAHMGEPVGVHSLNNGLTAAREITDGLARIRRKGGVSQLLEDFAEDGLSRWRRFYDLERTVVAQAGADDWIADNRARIVPCLPASGTELETLIRQIGLEIRG